MASDAELIGLSVTGDGEAFVEVVQRHEAAVGAYLARRAGREVAKDLLGEVWLAAFGSRRTYDRSFADARPWLFGVAHNTLRRHWRSLLPEEPLPDVAGPELGWDPWPAVDERVDGAETVRTALLGLRTTEREVLTLVVWEDLTVADAARALGIPSGTAYRYLHQARVALREAPRILELLADMTTVRDAK